MRTCTRCRQIKEISEFSKNSASKDGLNWSCKACAKLASKAWSASMPDDSKAARKAWQRTNSDKANAYNRAWKKANPDKNNALKAKRRAIKLQRTPPWLTKAQLKEIRGYYSLAKELQWLTNEPLHVDHIIPLQGENVSGLHVPWNLQVLPRSANCSKGNKLDPKNTSD